MSSGCYKGRNVEGERGGRGFGIADLSIRDLGEADSSGDSRIKPVNFLAVGGFVSPYFEVWAGARGFLRVLVSTLW